MAQRRIAKGRRPQFAADVEVDRVLAMVMALVGEVSVLRERMDAFERLIERHGVLSREEIDAFQPDEAAQDARAAWRAAYLERILWIMREDLDHLDEDGAAS